MTQSFYGTRYLLAPVMAFDEEKAAYFTSLLDSAYKREQVSLIELDGRYPKHEFLCFLVERKGLLIRGSNQCDIEVFEPQEGTDYFGNPTKAVYAASDGIWPIFFAIVNRRNPQLHVLWNACMWARTDAGQLQKIYAFADVPFVQGTVYLLPSDGFRQIKGRYGLPTAECLSEESVRPLVRLSVSPDEFPFLDQIRPFDVEDLMTQHQVLAGVTRIVEHSDGYTLSFDLQRTSVERIQRAVQFTKEFYPAWHLQLSEYDRYGISLRIRFPTGAIRFCKEELLEKIQALHEDFSAIERG